MENKELTAKELIEMLKKVPPNAVIATSDYFGINHQLYKPTITHIKAGESFNDLRQKSPSSNVKNEKNAPFFERYVREGMNGSFLCLSKQKRNILDY